jgi:hypothetical protein
LHNEELQDFLYWTIFSSNQTKEDEKVGTHCTYGIEEERLTEFWWGNLKGGDNLEDLGVEGRIELK